MHVNNPLHLLFEKSNTQKQLLLNNGSSLDHFVKKKLIVMPYLVHIEYDFATNSLPSPPEMEFEAQCRKIEETVIEVLRDADLEKATEHGVRAAAADRLGFSLSELCHKQLVRRVVESYLLSLPAEDNVHEGVKEVVPERQQQQEKSTGFDSKEVAEKQQQDHIPNFNSKEVPEQQQQERSPNFDPKEVRTDGGGRVICKLSAKTILSIQNFREKNLVSIRDYYQKDGKQFPSDRGISLTTKQWSTFRSCFPALEEAIAKMESRFTLRKVMYHKSVREQIEADMSSPVTAFASPGFVPIHHGHERRQIEAGTSNSVSNFAPPSNDQHDSVALVPIETTRLNGKNYHCWVHQMIFFLKQLKIAYVLTERCPSIPLQTEASFEEIVQAKASEQKWVGDDYICRRNILNSLSDHLFDQYSKRTCSAKELWEELKLVYDEDFGTKRSEINKYIQFQMVDGIPILEQVQELHNIADSIIASGTWIDENFHVSAIISKLPPSWKEYRMSLMHAEFLPLNMLMHHLKVEEESRSRCKEAPSKNAHEIGSRLDDKVGPRKREPKRLCYSCGKEGHISRQCQQKKIDIQLQKKRKDRDVMPVAMERLPLRIPDYDPYGPDLELEELIEKWSKFNWDLKEMALER
ncbi:hypothetical protein RJ639_029809 [Escallonia herrerae]|uniref:CCHC-type domain-containing protein n=1 Tax=Escallonia herrerae TaxID=1293975 RepID=A0AA88WXW4_9ASTE|nr:hypothetical protein RJ639_029809 [Escallonia herrerae]